MAARSFRARMEPGLNQDDTMADSFQCSVVTPERRVIDDQVHYASLPAWDGQLGIAPGRAPILVRLGIGLMRLDFASGGTHYYLVRGGFAQMLGDTLTILCNTALPGENVVEADAQQEYNEALQQRAVTDDEVQEKEDSLQTARAKRRVAQLVGQRGI